MNMTGSDCADALRVFLVPTPRSQYEAVATRDVWRETCLALGADPASLAPPDHGAYRRFANRMLLAGIPGSIIPVESLYKPWDGSATGAARRYLGDSARHVQQLCGQLRIGIPDEFAAMPDHLALLLELHAFLKEHAPAGEAEDFAASHFDWLPTYLGEARTRMQAPGTDPCNGAGRFYLRLIEAIEKWVTGEEAE